MFEEKIDLLEQEMCTPEVYSDHEKSNAINLEMLELKEKLESTYLEWMELTE